MSSIYYLIAHFLIIDGPPKFYFYKLFGNIEFSFLCDLSRTEVVNFESLINPSRHSTNFFLPSIIYSPLLDYP